MNAINPQLDTPEKRWAKALELGRVFSPAGPIQTQDLFFGRIQQIQRVIDAIHQRGRHVAIHGDRGLGKTSLANVVSSVLASYQQSGFNVAVGRANCNRAATLGSTWESAFETITYTTTKSRPGIETKPTKESHNFSERLPAEPRVEDIIRLIKDITSEFGCQMVFIFDEFDVLPRDVSAIFTDIIKTLSDHGVPATIMLVGVAQTVNQLVEDHGSIERSLSQVEMPRMLPDELVEVLKKAETVGVKFSQSASNKIVTLSQGLPHYTHLIGLASARVAVEGGSLTVLDQHVQDGIGRALQDAIQSIKQEHHDATYSPHKGAMFDKVLIACALAQINPQGFFKAADVSEPMKKITGDDWEVPQFARHLNEFCKPERGPALVKSGQARAHIYRFMHPLMQPYVIMKALHDKIITMSLL